MFDWALNTPQEKLIFEKKIKKSLTFLWRG